MGSRHCEGKHAGRHFAKNQAGSSLHTQRIVTILGIMALCAVSGMIGALVSGLTPAVDPSQSTENIVTQVADAPLTQFFLSGSEYASLPGMPNWTYMQKAKWEGSMPASGEARVLVIRVGFPDILYENGKPFQDGDTTEGMSDFIGRHLDGSITCGDDGHPYESLYAYYLRSSYGKLRIAGEAYEYIAKKNREDYSKNLDSLFEEALQALGDDIDYADYDGNGDGVLDCVCIRFSGDTTGWATEWWPHVFMASGEMSKPSFDLDGKSLGSLIMLSYPSSGLLVNRTFLHEMGHAIGLPDYYSSPYEMAEDKNAGKEYAGIGTFDMMGSNIGDHCGFSKWMLGWMPESNVIKVTSNKEGVATARMGDEELDKALNGKVRLRVERISGNGITNPGNLVAIYPTGESGLTGPLADMYLLEYDGFAGNNSVYWGTQVSKWPLEGGFRLFRVQASMAGIGKGLVHDNKTDEKYDQLIELVDPDGGMWHQSSNLANTVPTATSHEKGQVVATVERNGGYGCMLRKGDVVSPDTIPSTNFREDAEGGRTGIGMEIIRTEEDYGLVDIWYE